MIPDAHTPCPVCAGLVRDALAIARRVVRTMAGERPLPPEYEELYRALEAVQPLIDAHHANQDHAFSKELAPWREQGIKEPT